MAELAKRLSQLPGVEGGEYAVPDPDNAYFHHRPLPWAVVYDGTEKEVYSDCHTQVTYTLMAGVELVFAYDDRHPMLEVGNDLLAHFRILVAQANDQGDQLGGLIRWMRNTSADVWAFPSERSPRRGRVICIPEITYTAPAKNPWWPQGS